MKIAGVDIRPDWIMWGVGIGALMLWWMGRGDRDGDGVPDGILPNLGYNLGNTAAKTVGGVAEGVLNIPSELVFGIGRGLGVPDTRSLYSKEQCRLAMEAGDDWKASFYCPAATSIKGWFDGK